MKISDRFEKEVCPTCENNLLCNKDMKQLTACATLEIWNILIKNQYEVGVYKIILDENEKVLEDMIKRVI